jgi:16S rRNA (guanine(527)-N(7))-methyltransferase RsmG
MPAPDFPYPPDELLSRGLAELGFPETDGSYRSVAVRGIQSIIPLVSRYIKELELFNAVFDLVGAEPGTDRGRSDLVVRHILDSLAPWKEIAVEAERVLGGSVPDSGLSAMPLSAVSGNAGAAKKSGPVLADGTSASQGFAGARKPDIAPSDVPRVSQDRVNIGNAVVALADGASANLAESASVTVNAGSSAAVFAEGAPARDAFARCAPEIADVGSGAGFPGIPLAIIFPDFRFTLVERMSKRCAFLENCVAILGLKNVTVLNSEMEKAPTGRFDVVVFRAFRPLDREMVRGLLSLTRRADDLRASGILSAWKARADKISVEMEAIADELDGWRVLPVTVPFLAHEERNLVVTASAKRPNRPR